jgi:hypothetical protein
MASKYDPLAEHLGRQRGPTLTMRFAEIEGLVGPLPTSSYTWRAWWANDQHHVQARAGWLAAGWKVDSVSQSQHVVTFRRWVARRPSGGDHVDPEQCL